jgi:hypothetical protein
MHTADAVLIKPGGKVDVAFMAARQKHCQLLVSDGEQTPHPFDVSPGGAGKLCLRR